MVDGACHFSCFCCVSVNAPLNFLDLNVCALQTPILWSHGIDDRTVLFEAGQAGPPFLERAGLSCEFKVICSISSPTNHNESLIEKLTWFVHLILKAYPGLGHSISTEELKHLESWIKNRLQSSS